MVQVRERVRLPGSRIDLHDAYNTAGVGDLPRRLCIYFGVI